MKQTLFWTVGYLYFICRHPSSSLHPEGTPTYSEICHSIKISKVLWICVRFFFYWLFIFLYDINCKRILILVFHGKQIKKWISAPCTCQICLSWKTLVMQDWFCKIYLIHQVMQNFLHFETKTGHELKRQFCIHLGNIYTKRKWEWKKAKKVKEQSKKMFIFAFARSEWALVMIKWMAMCCKPLWNICQS